MPKNQLPSPQSVQFNDQSLTVITGKNGERYVAMKPICENIGLDWDAQRQRIKRDEVLSTCTVMMTVQMPGDGQSREITCLPLEYLNGWLFGIDISRCREEIRPALIQYKRECFKVLSDYWQHGQAINERHSKKWQAARLESKTVRRSETDSIQELVEYAQAQGSKNAQMYYVNITKLVNSLMGIDPGDRDSLSKYQLRKLTLAETAADLAIQDGIAEGLDYKQIYPLIKTRCQAVVGTLSIH